MTDERYLGGFKNRLIVGANLHNGEIDNKQYVNNCNSGSAIKGALQSSSLDKSENVSAYIENSFFFLPTWRSSPARSSCTRRATGRTASSTKLASPRCQGRRFGPHRVQPLEPEGRPAVERRSDVAGVRQCLAQRRGAELRRELTAVNRYPVHRSSRRRPRRPTRLGTRGRRPDYTWDLAVYRAEIKNELQCLYSALRQLRCASMPIGPCIRASRSASARHS